MKPDPEGKDQYAFRVVCENCGHKTVDHENIGTQRPEFVKCPLCQCKARTQTIDKDW